MVQTPYAGFVFEGLANRNSLGYADIYGLGDLSGMDTMFRGTLRYQGYSDLLYAFRKLGFLDQVKPVADQCHTWVCVYLQFDGRSLLLLLIILVIIVGLFQFYIIRKERCTISRREIPVHGG